MSSSWGVSLFGQCIGQGTHGRRRRRGNADEASDQRSHEQYCDNEAYRFGAAPLGLAVGGAELIFSIILKQWQALFAFARGSHVNLKSAGFGHLSGR